MIKDISKIFLQLISILVRSKKNKTRKTFFTLNIISKNKKPIILVNVLRKESQKPNINHSNFYVNDYS